LANAQNFLIDLRKKSLRLNRHSSIDTTLAQILHTSTEKTQARGRPWVSLAGRKMHSALNTY